MSDSLESLRRKIGGAGDLESVVRSMKALAAASVGQYERSVLALTDYYRTVEMGLAVCLKDRSKSKAEPAEKEETVSKRVTAIVFGSDQGLVGQFNDLVADHAVKVLDSLAGEKHVWAVGDRIQSRLVDAGHQSIGVFAVPTAVNSISRLVGEILVQTQAKQGDGGIDQLYLFHNRPMPGATFEPVSQCLLPLDKATSLRLTHFPWPTKTLPEIIGDADTSLRALISEYLFVSLFKCCSESLASENASRLAAMQRAEKNIDELVEDLNQTFRRLRQSSIDEELFDVISGYESMSTEMPR